LISKEEEEAFAEKKAEEEGDKWSRNNKDKMPNHSKIPSPIRTNKLTMPNKKKRLTSIGPNSHKIQFLDSNHKTKQATSPQSSSRPRFLMFQL